MVKKTSEIKKFYWERNVFKTMLPLKKKKKKKKVFKTSKAKKAFIYKENDFGFISEIRNLTFQYHKVSIKILLDFSN